MRRKIRRFIQRNGGPHLAEGVGQLLVRWDRAARQVARWRRQQIACGELGLPCPVGSTPERAARGLLRLQTHPARNSASVVAPTGACPTATPSRAPRCGRSFGEAVP